MAEAVPKAESGKTTDQVTGFDTITIEEATDRLIDYRGKTPPKTNAGVRLITAKVVKGGQILNEPAEFIAADFYNEWMRRGLPQKFDVLLTTEAPLGEVAVLRDSEKIALAQRIILLRAKPGLIDPLFLFYALQSDFGQGELKARASGTTVLGIKQSELRQVRIPIFALPVQRRIAGILSAYDELMENSQRRIRLLEAMARALYREWFVHFRFPGHEKLPRVASPLGDIPQGWEGRFGDLATIERDGINPFEFPEEEFAGQFGSLAIGTSTSHQRVKPENLLAMPSTVPDRKTIARFSKLVSPMLTVCQQLRSQIQNLRRTRDLLLPRLLSGQVEFAVDTSTKPGTDHL